MVFFDLNGVRFVFRSHDEAAKDMGMTTVRVLAYEGYCLAHNVQSEEEVDEEEN